MLVLSRGCVLSLGYLQQMKNKPLFYILFITKTEQESFACLHISSVYWNRGKWKMLLLQVFFPLLAVFHLFPLHMVFCPKDSYRLLSCTSYRNKYLRLRINHHVICIISSYFLSISILFSLYLIFFLLLLYLCWLCRIEQYSSSQLLKLAKRIYL